jgi:hypothetical protein
MRQSILRTGTVTAPDMAATKSVPQSARIKVPVPRLKTRPFSLTIITTVDHTLDGVAAYKAAALEVLEPGMDHGPVHPLPGPVDKVPPQNVRHAYEDHDGR